MTQRSTEDDALIAGLQSEVAALTAELAAVRTEKRTAALTALFAAIGRDLPEGEALAPYLAMPEESFAIFSADLAAVAAPKPGRDAALFSATAPARAQAEQDHKTAASLTTAVARLVKSA